MELPVDIQLIQIDAKHSETQDKESLTKILWKILSFQVLKIPLGIIDFLRDHRFTCLYRNEGYIRTCFKQYFI